MSELPGTDTRLHHELHELARHVEPPMPPAVAAGHDLARGRRRLRRRRGAMLGGVVAAVLAVTGSTVTLPGMLGAAGPAPEPATSPGPTPGPEEAVTERTVTPRASGAEIGRGPWASHAAVLREWNDVLASHVDPGREHLSPWGGRNRNVQLSGGSGSPRMLGSRFEWTEPGREQLAMLQLEVARDRDELSWRCDADSAAIEQASCSTLEAQAGAVEVARLDGDVVAVAAEREDGEMVVLTFSPWYANNSLTPLETDPPALEAMAAAATDPRLTLAGTEVPVPAWSDAMVERADQLFSAEGYQLQGNLVDASEALGSLTRGSAEIHLKWSVHPLGEDAARLEDLCKRGVHRSCLVRRVGEREVLIAVHRANPRSIDVVHRGSSAWARVEMHGVLGRVPLPVDTAVALVLDERWQSAG